MLQKNSEKQSDAVLETLKKVPNRKFIDDLSKKRDRILRDKTKRWSYNFMTESAMNKNVFKCCKTSYDPSVKSMSPRKSTVDEIGAIDQLSEVNLNLLTSPVTKV